MTEGDWRLGVFIDDAASDEQAAKLGAVFGGELGGSMEALGPLIGENLGVERAPIDFSSEDGNRNLRVDEAIEIEVEDLVPFGSASGKPARLVDVFHPANGELDPGAGKELPRQRLRDGLRQRPGNVRVLDHLLLGRLSR